MVRETRHLWVGNLPDNIREDRIREHFKRYGRVQNVKLLGRTESAPGAAAVAGVVAVAGASAGAVASAGAGAVAGAAAGAAAAVVVAGVGGSSGVCATVAFMDIKSASKAHNAEHVLDERTLTTEYYEPAAIPSSATGAPSAGSSPAGSGYSGSSSSVNSAPAPASVSRYHLSGGEEGTGTTCAIAATAAAPANWRGTNDSATDYCRRGNTPATYGRYQRNNAGAPYATPPSNVERSTPHHRWYGSGERGATGGESTPSTPGGCTESGRRRRRSGSGSSRSDSSSPEASDASRASTPAAGAPPHNAPHLAGGRTPPSHHHQWASTASGRPLAICVRNLPIRSTDSSLKDGLYHEYKKHGKVVWVKVVGQNADRYAVVRFKKPSDVEKALEVSQDKLFFGCKISVAPHQSCDEDADSAKPYETDIDEYHPKATRTLFIGNLEKDVTQQQLRDKFKHYGRIIEIDIKKGSGGGAGYAFCQYASISSVVEAIRAMDGEYVGASRVKLGFGKPVATTCVWVDGLTEHTEKQEAFYEQLEKHGGVSALAGAERVVTGGDLNSRYDGCGSRSRASSYGRGSSRTPRYSTLEHYDPADYAADRRYRVYEELDSSPQADETSYEDRLQSVVVSPLRARRHRRDSSPEDRKHSKERHRIGLAAGARRSRSGSRGGEKHVGRRRHRRRRDGSGSRAGTPLRDEPDAPPCEPRRPPRERPPLPMSLPLPKFAAQLLRSAQPASRPNLAPALAPDSPPRPPSASSSSAGSAPHSPSLEERIRSLDEKYEKWSGSRAVPEAPDRTRLRHRLLEVDINEVKPSEVVRSLLAKRSVFDEDTERLEGATRPPSPGGSPRARAPHCVPRALRYPFPAHPPPHTPSQSPLTHAPHTPPTPHPSDVDPDACDRPADPRLNRPERPYQMERLGKFNESDYKIEPRIRLRTPSTDKSLDAGDRRRSPRAEKEVDRDPRRDLERRRRDSLYSSRESESKSSFDAEEKEVKEAIEKIDPDFQSRENNSVRPLSSCQQEEGLDCCDNRSASPIIDKKKDELFEHQIVSLPDQCDRNSSRHKENLPLKQIARKECSKPEQMLDIIVKCEKIAPELPIQIETMQSLSENKLGQPSLTFKTESDKCKEILLPNHINKEIIELEMHLNAVNSIKSCKEMTEISDELIKSHDKNGKERYNQNIILEAFHTKLEKENIEFDKSIDKDKCTVDKKSSESDKITEERHKNDRDKNRHYKERPEKGHDDKSKSNKIERCDKNEKLHSDKTDKAKIEKEIDRPHKEKNDPHKERNDRDVDKIKHVEEKSSKHDHHRKEKVEKDKRKDSVDTETSKVKKEDKYKHERRKDNSDSKRESKKDPDAIKIRKSSRDETCRDICRKDSTDSSTSRASHDSFKNKDLEHMEIKEDSKLRVKYYNDLFTKQEVEKDLTSKVADYTKHESTIKNKTDVKEEKDIVDPLLKNKIENNLEHSFKSKDITEKQRHYSLDSPTVDCKRKERLNSCSSLPPNIGHKRRMSSQDSFDSLHEDIKKSKNDLKCPERRDSKDSRTADRHKTTKFNKGHFAKIIESKTKDDKKNQVKPPDDAFLELKDVDVKDPKKPLKKSPKGDEEKGNMSTDMPPEGLHNDLDFLATLQLRSSEEDEKQKALRKEMKEKKRIQQLQQIQELQMQQDALQHAELMGKLKDEKKQKSDDKKKELAREKRMSTDRKSRDDKNDNGKNRNTKSRKQLSTDSSDSDEPKKHSIFDIIDDEPTYISMYDKVKARSCKNMQKQEEEKRQEKIKAKFSQLKQSRAKREEKKRSSWDEDSDSEQDRQKPQKISMGSSSEDEQIVIHSKKREKSHGSSLDYDHNKTNDYFSIPSTEEDSRNKLSRKNSRTRIISDTSEDENSKRSISKSPNFIHEIRKELMSDFESLKRDKDEVKDFRDSCDKIKKNSLLNLFGKSDSDDSKIKSSFESNDNKASFVKTLSNEYSSESESMISSRNTEVRKKHKKKQKKHKFSFSDGETKIESSDTVNLDTEAKHKHSDKIRRHSNKKEKRKDKSRNSIDADENREDKIKSKKDRKLLNNCFDSSVDSSSNNVKKEGKMEDIFGPLSDESDREVESQNNKEGENESSFNDKLNTANSDEIKLKEDKRKREKKRKEKRPYIKEDDNSLDVDAVSKAIEARLFADSLTDDENRTKVESVITLRTKDNVDYDDNILSIETGLMTDKHNEKLKRDCKEKRKKKKKNKEDRQSRKDHHHFNHKEKTDKIDNLYDKDIVSLSPKSILLDIPLPNDTEHVSSLSKMEGRYLLSESVSLPRLTDSPPVANLSDENSKDNFFHLSGDHNTDIDDFVLTKQIEVINIPMPPPIDNIVHDISEVPLPSDPIPIKSEQIKTELFLPPFGRDIDVSDDAVRSISILEKDTGKIVDKNDSQISKNDKKEEKPRAIISQEETEDAVAALLGESFGGKGDVFTNCYEEVENNTTHQIEIESAAIESENIPEEDAEEMRQAVQNLNASEMEIKPDTPVSDNDLLLIDTDTEEPDETPQDCIDRLPVNIIATNQSLNITSEARAQNKTVESSNIVIPKQKPLVSTLPLETKETSIKLKEADIKLHLPKRDIAQQITSTATPVITSWTLTKNALSNKETTESKPTHITTNIVQIKAPQNHNIPLRPVITPTRVNAPYQVINHMMRPQVPNMQPPTIKIPEHHISYSKQPGIVISPRMTNDPRLQSPKSSPQSEGMTSPRLANMTILNTSPQNLNSVGIASPNAMQQRSPGQVTVVRMQQPPLSPIQAMHLPPGTRAMVSPNRPNSVLVQTQGAPIHFNRLPVTPILTPISKQMNVNNMIQQKSLGVNTTALMHQQKVMSPDCRKNDQRGIGENVNENSKIILSPTNLQHSTNPTVMAQNRLISMQNAIHAGNINTTLHMANKVLLNNMSHLNEKRESQVQKSEHHNPFGSSPIIHVTGVGHSAGSIIQSGTKPIMCTLQEANNINRGQGSNVIHTINSQRLLTTAPISSMLHIESNKGSPSVLSMATIRSPTVLTKLESSSTVAVTTSSLSNVVMTPLSLKSSSVQRTIRLNTKNDMDNIENQAKINNHLPYHDDKIDVKNDSKLPNVYEDRVLVKQKDISMKSVKSASSPVEQTSKCETDFEELLKDNTNEIKITNNPEKKLEVNVGNTVTLFATSTKSLNRKMSTESYKKELTENKGIITDNTMSQVITLDNKEDILKRSEIKTKDSATDNATVMKSEVETMLKDKNNFPEEEALIAATYRNNNEDQEDADSKSIEKLIKHDIAFAESMSKHDESEDIHIKSLDENDSWSAKDLNIESVIKKVDSLCNDNIESDQNNSETAIHIHESFNANLSILNEPNRNKPIEIQSENENVTESSSTEESSTVKTTPVSKRGGRSVRGKKLEKNQDRIQTRQISKPPRGAMSAKRGRGRAKVDKKIKSLINNSLNNMPGDVYDFHEDSGDESTPSPNKTEPRPRLILTIKSPLSGQSNAIATSTLSITSKDHVISSKEHNISPKDQHNISPKDQQSSSSKDQQSSSLKDQQNSSLKDQHNISLKDQHKNVEKISKDEKIEDFVSPSTNTRKSRRLQEKDVQRNMNDDGIDDVIKSPTTQTKVNKDGNKKRQTRQAGGKTIQPEKSPGLDTRKSPRGVKRTRDRSLSDASVDSSDEKIAKREDVPKDTKVIKVAESLAAPKQELDPPPPVKTNPTTIIQSAAPTPIMKPPKKMISEISAKLASAFEAAASATPVRQPHQVERLPLEVEKQPPLIREPRNPELATTAPSTELMAAATCEARVANVSTGCVEALNAAGGGEAALVRRHDAVGGGMAPVGATEASDARVQSPALPHRPPSAHRLADRATPLLIRGGEGEGASVASVASCAGVGAGAGGGVRPRGYAGTASLPRGAHHPPHPPPAPPAPHPSHPSHPHHPHHAQHPHHPPQHPQAKQVAVVGPHHHPGAASRVTITSVPTISPQGQIALGEGMYHFSQQHYQMYQQHFRATQHESRASPSPYTRSLEAEGCEAPTPPLELRRPHTARVPRPAHSPSPADRHIMYAAGCGRSPPPAHGTSRLPAALPPIAAPGPPHASQVPREADSLQMLLRRYPVMWQGLLALKNDSAAVQMHFVGGNPGVAGDTLPRHTDGSTPPLRIAQRMRLEPAQLDQVHRKMKLENEHCILLALPCGRDHMDVLQQSTNLTAGFITYLQRKQAAGIVNVAPPGHHQAMYTVHIFPSCDFANENLNRIAPDLMHRVADIAHLLIVIATATV